MRLNVSIDFQVIDMHQSHASDTFSVFSFILQRDIIDKQQKYPAVIQMCGKRYKSFYLQFL